MIVVHHLRVSQSERIVWLLEELGLPYALRCYQREATGFAPPELRAVNPLGQAPVIQDGSVTLAESVAIVTYILELYGEGRLRISARQTGYADYLYWLNYSAGGLMPMAVQRLRTAMAGQVADTPGAQVAKEREQRHLGMIEARLAQHEWLAGDMFTAADIMCEFPFGTMTKFLPLDVTEFPHIAAWTGRLHARPAYLKLAQIDNDSLPEPGSKGVRISQYRESGRCSICPTTTIPPRRRRSSDQCRRDRISRPRPCRRDGERLQIRPLGVRPR